MLNQFRLIIGVLVVAVLVYCGLWYTAAFQAEKDVTRMLATWRDQGIFIQHGSVKHGGFPYRITVTVDSPTIATRTKGLTVSASSIELISHLWTPNHWLAETVGLKVRAAQDNFDITADTLLASYRLHNDGKAVVAFDSTAASGLIVNQFLGREIKTVKDWSLFLRFSTEAQNTDDDGGLYGARILDFKAGAEWQITEDTLEKRGDAALMIEAGVNGPALDDWSKDQLTAWASEGGLMEISRFEYTAAGARVTGNASLTLDSNFKPLGSASVKITNTENLNSTLAALGITPLEGAPANSELSLMAQNGELIADTTVVATLKPVIQ
ncbi:DUF2125 domain-containing protein [Kordiimonas pumila]|uniref:DUF2125 domain-containing protein n=1 Tax=Kordiimonas pumila TaxID=2161677 RepID=A0ABV7D0C0_9PROT|nr:DUF2125 domain-containing protein [Kordiimonas pumila]